MGDGVQFDVYLRDGRATYRLYSEYIDPKNNPGDRRWFDASTPLDRWAGQTVTLTFATGVGPQGNADYDWAGWGNPRIILPDAPASGGDPAVQATD